MEAREGKVMVSLQMEPICSEILIPDFHLEELVGKE